LAGRFSFLEYKYTSDVEAMLDEIANGRLEYQKLMESANSILDGEIKSLEGLIIGERHDCPECGEPLRKRPGKHGAFWGCSTYPKCKVTLPDDYKNLDLGRQFILIFTCYWAPQSILTIDKNR